MSWTAIVGWVDEALGAVVPAVTLARKESRYLSDRELISFLDDIVQICLPSYLHNARRNRGEGGDSAKFDIL
ncbi:hypothetical protein JB92DRAFT_2998259, partial [Gautieria morchelliformis]